MTGCNFISRHDPHRRRWGRSFFLAISLHGAVVGAALMLLGQGSWPLDEEPAVTPLVRGMLAEQVPLIQEQAGEAAHEPAGREESIPVESTHFEPDGGVIRDAAARIVADARQPVGMNALEELSRRAATLEAISSRSEVERMARQITAALGAGPSARATSQPAEGPFDYDRALLLDITRRERTHGTVITETFVDPAGRQAMIRTIREVDSRTGAVTYRRILKERGDAPTETAATQEEFELAASRERPYAIINRFPLMQQLHREAVMPLLDKLTAEESADRAANLRNGPEEQPASADGAPPAPPPPLRDRSRLR